MVGAGSWGFVFAGVATVAVSRDNGNGGLARVDFVSATGRSALALGSDRGVSFATFAVRFVDSRVAPTLLGAIPDSTFRSGSINGISGGSGASSATPESDGLSERSTAIY